MVAGGLSMAIASMWSSMAAWFTPTVLFCATNLIIATIFIASNHNNKHHHHDGDPPARISRVYSFLDRARSMKLPSYPTTTTTIATVESPSRSETATYSSSSRLAQSIHSSEPVSQPAHAPSLFQRVKSIKFHNENEFPANFDNTGNSPGQLVRSPSFLDRVRSFRISSAFTKPESVEPVVPSRESDHHVNTDTSHDSDSDHHVIRSKSDKSSAKKASVEMKKSRSERRMAGNEEEEDVDMRRPATARERRNDEVDARADDFISRFKQQLKLQRIESLVRYNEILNRRG